MLVDLLSDVAVVEVFLDSCSKNTLGVLLTYILGYAAFVGFVYAC